MPRQGDLFDALHGRLAQVLGAEFAENALPIDAERDGFHLTGFAALADLFARALPWRSICSSTAARSGTSC